MTVPLQICRRSVWFRHPIISTLVPVSGSSGQGTVEWIGLVFAIAAAMIVGGALAQASFVGGAVTRQMARAICVVKGGDCERDREPCAVNTSRRRRGATLSILPIDVGFDRTLVVERLSDGTLRVTEIDSGLAALKARFGLAADARAGSSGVSVGGSAAVSVAAAYHGGRSWVVRSEAERDRLLAQVAAGRGEPGGRLRAPGRRNRIRELGRPPVPDVVYDDVVTTAGARGGAEFGAGRRRPLSLGGGHEISRLSGEAVDRRTGELTAHLDQDAIGDVGLLIAGKRVAGRRSAPDAERHAVVFDVAGRPLALRVVATGTKLPPIALPFAGMVQGARPGRSYEVTAHLDLTDPVNLAAARDLLSELDRGRSGRFEQAAARLRDRIEQAATVEVRALETSGRDRGVGGGVTIPGGRLGGRIEVSSRETRLVAAASRGLDGGWLPRDDCTRRLYAEGRAPLESPGEDVRR